MAFVVEPYLTKAEIGKFDTKNFLNIFHLILAKTVFFKIIAIFFCKCFPYNGTQVSYWHLSIP